LESWPRTAARHRAACHFCDALHEAPALEEGREARCGVCGAVLYRNRPASLERTVAFALAALLLMVVAHSFPFLSLEASGNRSVMTLGGASLALMEEGSELLGLGVAVFTFLAPVLLAAGLVYVGLPLLWGRRWPGAVPLARLMKRAEPWAMIEVFFLGSLVSLLKLVKLAEVHLGAAFWALGAVMICLAAAMAAIDSRELWDRLEVAAER
jgi:paraquat-inducible protein A